MRKTGFYKTCEKCTKLFWCHQYNADRRRFCSLNCSNKTNASTQSKTKRSKSRLNLGTETPRQFDDWQYIEWRNKCLARDNKICQNCKKDVSGKNQAVAHHIKSWEDEPLLRYEISNSITLCRGCHNKVHILPSRKKRSGF